MLGGFMSKIETETHDNKLSAFLVELTELSRRFQFGITPDGVLFSFEADDFERTYSCDDESRLIYN